MKVVAVILYLLFAVVAVFGALVADHTHNFWVFLVGSAPLAIMNLVLFFEKVGNGIEAAHKRRKAAVERRQVD